MPAHMICTYEEAIDLLREVGILPLSSFIPDYPSLESVTPKEQWYTGAPNDPWMWRSRLADEGVAAYGRFFKKKPVLVAAELFPLLQAILGDDRTVEVRYRDGVLSGAAKQLYEAISAEGGIETRALRAQVGMQGKESKSEYDKALIELQETCEIVIAGTAANFNEEGQKQGWNGTCYELAERWYAGKGHVTSKKPDRAEAHQQLMAHLERVCAGNEKALVYFKKIFKIASVV